jgi:DNA-directed RNA polymerase specialized sigma24 family protein
VIPGELSALVERCRADEAAAWDRFAVWVRERGRAIYRGVHGLSDADRDDAAAETLTRLVSAVRRGEIRGTSNAEIDAYVCTALRRRGLNVLRGLARRPDAARDLPEERGAGATASRRDAVDGGLSQDAHAIAAEQLGRAEKLLLSWPADDRYLFIAKLNGVSSRVIQETLEQPPFRCFVAIATVDTRFQRLRRRVIEYIQKP